MRTGSFLSLGPHAFHRIAFVEWGDPDNDRVLICAHGLTRNGRDFDFLAGALLRDYRVVCPDIVGRGYSGWIDVKEDYSYPTYCTDLAALMARLDVQQVDWIGTSMGGLIGLLLAAQANTPIRRLVLNDIGPFVPKSALARMAVYVGTDPRFDALADVASYLREIHAGFGALTAEQWNHLARHSARKTEDGSYALHYDPGIAVPFTSGPQVDVNLWSVWDKVQGPVLVLRGGDSDLLLAETTAEMQKRRPQAEVVEFPGVGHAPALMSDDQIGIVHDWLLS
jgi:pimeloyl-ACP methyl ester carboxylesterase